MGRYLLTLLATVALMLPLAASAQQDAVTVSIDPRARLVDDGAGAIVSVRVSCPAGRQVLEAFVMLSQDNVNGMGGLPVACDGHTHRYRSRVNALDGRFQPGHAQASAFVLVQDQTGATEQGQDSRTILLTR
jgi:hypothetical protein